MENSQGKNNKTLIGLIIGILLLIVVIALVLRGCSTKKYTVTFETNGGTVIEPVKVKENDKVAKPQDPTKDGYTFGGWYYEDELFDFDTKITKDITLEAYWNSDNIELETTKMSLVLGKERKIEILSLPKGLTENDLVYSSSDESIVTVDEDGNLKALKTGTVTITVKSKDGNYTTQCTVTVVEKEVEVESVSITGDSTVTVGSSIKLTATFKPNDATNNKLKWESSDTSIATVDEDGNVKGLKVGKVTITVTTENGKTATKEITVNEKSYNNDKPTSIDPTGVSVTGQHEVNVGENIQLSATVNPSNATNKSVKWSSSNNSIATVDGNGKVTGVSSGTVTITVTTANGKTATFDVTVKDVYVIYLTKRELAVVGGAIQYDFRVERNKTEFTDYLGFTYNDTKVAKDQGTVSSTAVEKGGNTASLKLPNGDVVTATVIVN